MALIIGRKVIMSRLVFGATLLCSCSGCTGPLVYRPKKAKPESVLVTAAKTKSDLPPLPDRKANNATLAGIDTTGAGIRDDVHIWIYTNYTSTKKRVILMGMAKNLQDVMVNPPKTAEDAKKVNQSYSGALSMLRDIPGIQPRQVDEMDSHLYLQTVNTSKRLQEYLQYNSLLEGKSSH